MQTFTDSADRQRAVFVVPKRIGSLAVAVALALLFIAAGPHAATLVPQKGGVGGFVNLGGGALAIESNLIASLANGFADTSDEIVDSLDESPDEETTGIPTVNFEFSYTFAEARTQVYVGNLLEDFLTLDLSARAGIRQEVGRLGILGAAYLRTSASTDVWSDPYAVGVRRQDTEYFAEGIRLNWDRVLGSGLEIAFTSKSLDVDNERSGQSLGLGPAEAGLLDRNGDLRRLDLGYELLRDNKRHILTPGIFYRDADLDGNAMANDGYGFNLNYIYLHSERWRWVFNFSYQDMEYDAINPVFGQQDDAERLGASATAFYASPFGWKNWTLNVTAGVFREDHDIDFYDTSVNVATVGFFRQF